MHGPQRSKALLNYGKWAKDIIRRTIFSIQDTKSAAEMASSSDIFTASYRHGLHTWLPNATAAYISVEVQARAAIQTGTRKHRDCAQTPQKIATNITTHTKRLDVPVCIEGSEAGPLYYSHPMLTPRSALSPSSSFGPSRYRCRCVGDF